MIRAILDFSGIEDSYVAESATLRADMKAARDKTREKARIVKKLENVRGLVGIIKAVGESVSDVSVHCLRSLAYLLRRRFQINPAVKAAFSAVNYLIEV